MNALLRFGMMLTLVMVAGFATAQNSQNDAYKQQATFSENMTLEIPTSDVLPFSYEVDISGVAFKDDAAAKKYFNSITDNLVSYELQEDNKVIVRLQYEHLGDQKWGHEEWRTYLAKVADRYKDYFDRINAN